MKPKRTNFNDERTCKYWCYNGWCNIHQEDCKGVCEDYEKRVVCKHRYMFWSNGNPFSFLHCALCNKFFMKVYTPDEIGVRYSDDQT